MSENATGDNPAGGNGPDEISDEERRKLREHPGAPVDTGSVAGQSPKDDPDEEGEDRFDAG